MRQRKGCLWLALGLILALLAGAMVFVTLQRTTAVGPVGQEIPKTEVAVAARDIPLGAVIQEDDVTLKEVPTEVVPKDAVLSLDEAIGKMTTVELVKGEMLLASKLIAPTKELAEAVKQGENIAFTIEEGQVVMAFPTTDLMSTLGLLEPGDRIDILCSLDVAEAEEAPTGLVTFSGLQNLEIAAVILSPAAEKGSIAERRERVRPQAILLALDPQDALILKHLIDVGGIIDIVLRAPTDQQLFETKPVNMDYLIDRYRIRMPISP